MTNAGINGFSHRFGHIPGVQRIAVLRANSIGDFLLTLPALEALRACYPRAEIILLGQTWHAEFLQNRPSPVDEVVAVPASPGIWELPGGGFAPAAEQHDFFDGMQARHFDLALQLHGGGANSNPFVLSLGAGTTAGLRAEGAAPLDRWIRYVYYQREVLRYLEVVALVGAEPVTMTPRIAVTAADRAEARSAWSSLGSGPLVVLHPGANDARRRWPIERFAAVGDALAGRGAQVVVTGHRADVPLAEAVVGAMAAPAHSVAGELSLAGLAGLLEAATLVVANDTGPRHLAEAVGTATVGVYWAENAINFGPMQAHRHRALISFQMECPVCGVHCLAGQCSHREPFVTEVTVAPVLAAAHDLLEIELRDSIDAPAVIMNW